ncbi:hypothetical protein BVX98_02590 [bacterium F11]|nr:hypothetical protein BVX98_02590 [bacterium F11]
MKDIVAKPSNLIWVILLSMGILGCGKKAIPQLATPSKTVATYLEYGPGMRSSVNVISFNHALSCFSADDQVWFKENYHTLDFEPGDEDAYNVYSKAHKQAFVFGEIVSIAGPKGYNRKITEKENDGEAALVEVEGYPTPIPLVKEGPNWRIKGLFGVNR